MMRKRSGLTVVAVGLSLAATMVLRAPVTHADSILTVTIGASGPYGSTPDLTNLPPTAPQITYGSGDQTFLPSNVTGSLTCATSADGASATGQYPITDCSGSSLADSADGLTVQYDLADSSYDVTPAALTVTANDQPGLVYGSSFSPSTLSWTAAGYLHGDTAASLSVQPSCSSTVVTSSVGQITSGVGEYPITCSGPTVDGNYSLTYVPGTLTVTPAPLTILTNDMTVPYGGKLLDSSFTWQVVGLVNGDSVSVLPRTPAGCTTNVRRNNTDHVIDQPATFRIFCSVSPGLDGNYEAADEAGNLTVTRAPVQVLDTPTRLLLGRPMRLQGVLQSGNGIFYLHGQPLAGRSLRFQLRQNARIKSCAPSSPTGWLGKAGCSVPGKKWKLGNGVLTVVYGGDSLYAPARMPFRVVFVKP